MFRTFVVNKIKFIVIVIIHLAVVVNQGYSSLNVESYDKACVFFIALQT